MPAYTDPVTGLPILTSGIPDEVDQIPFNAQVFPWDDYNAGDRPARGAAYPDDILPTSANIAGQDSRNPMYMQTIYTDGNHNLRVAVQSGGGGGQVKSGYAGTASRLGDPYADGGNATYPNLPYKTLASISWYGVCTGLTGGSSLAVAQIQVLGATGGAIRVSQMGAGASGLTVNRFVPFIPGLDPVASGLTGSTLSIFIQVNGGAWVIGFALDYLTV